MYGQMTAGSWIYIGTQGILQGTYECFSAIAERRFGGTPGRHGHAHRRPRRHGRRPAAGGDDERRRGHRASRSTRTASSAASRPATSTSVADDLDDALRAGRGGPGRPPRRCRSACSATPPRCCPALVARGRAGRHRHRPDVGPRPAQLRARRACRSTRPPSCAARDPDGYIDRARESMARHCEAMVAFLDRGAEVFDYGNSLRREAAARRLRRGPSTTPGFLPAYIRPLFCEGKGPFRWAALSGDPADIGATDQAVLDEFPENEALARWIRLAVGPGGVPGAARPHLLARLRRARPHGPALQRARRQRARCRRRS